MLLPRHSSSDQVTGSVHCTFVFGPVGPVFGPCSFCPQWPAYASQANGAVADRGGASGKSTAWVLSIREGAVVLSQPKPSWALWPSQTDCSK